MAKILIVDDELQIRLLLRQLLKKEGYEVEVASNGIEALTLRKKIPMTWLSWT